MKNTRMSLRIAAFAGLVLSASVHAQWTVSGSDTYFNLSGNVGIGVTSPAFNLHVVEGASTDGTRAIFGICTASTGVTNGVFGSTASSVGRGVIGIATSTTGDNFGVAGNTSSSSGRGVNGWASSTSGTNYGVFGTSLSTGGFGVYGWASATGVGFNAGVQGECASDYGTGVVGLATATSTSNTGVLGQTSSTVGVGVKGQVVPTSGVNAGVVGLTASSSGYGVYGDASSATGTIYGVWGRSGSASGYGVYSVGNSGASGTKSFRIDHPSDPANKYLLHYAIESAEVLNSYSGTARLDSSGTAEVQLPAYFASVNADPRYTLTAVGAPMPLLHVAREVSQSALADGERAQPGEAVPTCSFVIGGGSPGAKVSWRVEALRNDRWVRTHGAPVEIEKIGVERGAYLHPELFGKSAEMGPANFGGLVTGANKAK